MRAPINKRLLAAADFVRDGAVLADVGTDHAYLPIYLLSTGKIERAVLSDINRGPLDKAEENARSAGFLNSVSLHLSDGAASLSGMGITDYSICGMGGELIADIIDKAPHLKDGSIRLILQPMSKPEALREYLFKSGFEICGERYVTDEGKHYVCILASYSGVAVSFSVADTYFGKREVFFSADCDAFRAYMAGRKASLKRVIEGKRRGGIDSLFEEELLSELCERLDLVSS
ncbi:MAG: SAM-dependent methyltransferase [Clostridia bacterium]|nr:SAM-dependent methyltransferase [Clostridia bacterium]